MIEFIPDVFFLPLAVPDPGQFDDLDADVLARRIPDFLHQLLNHGNPFPTGMLEIQSPPGIGRVTWITMDSPPDPEAAFEMVPDGGDVRAVVTGEISASEDGLQLELFAYLAEDLQQGFSTNVRGRVSLDDPVTSLVRIARRLAKVLDVHWLEPPRGLLTGSPEAFLLFLQGLDNAMLLSGDLAIEPGEDSESLMRPFAEALALDPGFGLALRMAQSTLAMAMESERLDKTEYQRILDRCLSAMPWDGEGCVSVAEQLAVMGDDQRAIAWLEHATHLDPPPPRGLENLGILLANRGQTVAARNLWMRGVQVDGHPDFFAHLARLDFAEDHDTAAWDNTLRGLRRLRERCLRSAEWEEDGGASMLLQYLAEHLTDRNAPSDVTEALLGLCSQLPCADRVELGLCLLAAAQSLEARQELVAGLRGELEPLVRDQGVRALLVIDVNDFEQRFARAVKAVTSGRSRAGLVELRLFLRLQPDFWPAMFFCAVGQQRLGYHDEALDLFAEVLRLRPGQPDALSQLGLLFDRRGNPKRGLECVEEALTERPDDAKLLALRVRCLTSLGWREMALRAAREALDRLPGDRSLLRLHRRLGGDAT